MTSGDPIADRRLELGLQLRARGDLAAAVDVIGQALELAPAWAEGRFALADVLMQVGDDTAAEHFRAYLALDSADSMGARAKLAQLGAASATEELAPAYVERLFDQYAARFEHSVIAGLRYTGPRQLRDAITDRWPGRRFPRALDLGCGTGLMGEAVRDLAARLDGIDLSANMLAQARKKGLYDSLARLDVLAALRAREPYDLILAADVLVYLGDLAPVVMAAAAALTTGGVFGCTLQASAFPGYRLGADQRFSHNAATVADLFKRAFINATVAPGTFRREKDVDVPGLLVVAEKG
jgi:predicted TPR repeat methyltransferase